MEEARTMSLLKKIETGLKPGDPGYQWTSLAEYQAHRDAQPVDIERLRSLPVVAVEIDGERI